MASKKITYREAIEEMEEIINSIENDVIDVDELSEKVKRTTYLLKFCKKKLFDTKNEIDATLKEVDMEEE